MYIYIFRPTSRGVNTLSAKKWFRKIHRDFRKDRKYSVSRKLSAYRAGWLPAYFDRFRHDLSDLVCERDYLYLQTINGAYSKWLDADDVTEKIFYPFTDYLDLGSADGFYCSDGKEITGLITYRLMDKEMEILSLDSIHEKQEIGTSLLNKVISLAKNTGII